MIRLRRHRLLNLLLPKDRHYDFRTRRFHREEFRFLPQFLGVFVRRAAKSSAVWGSQFVDSTPQTSESFVPAAFPAPASFRGSAAAHSLLILAHSSALMPRAHSSWGIRTRLGPTKATRTGAARPVKHLAQKFLQTGPVLVEHFVSGRA